MADIFSKKKRSQIMSKIRSSKTKSELKIKGLMNILGFTYQPKNIYGKPDFANRKDKIAVFVDGCFWHGCPKHYVAPKSNRKFWRDKINKNVKRDIKTVKKLKKDGWRVIRVWEHSIRFNK